MDGIKHMVDLYTLTTFGDFFDELLYGSGAWIGLILIIALILLVTVKVKYSSALFIPICVFLGLFYLDNVSENSDFIYSVFIIWAMIPFLLFLEKKRE
jgi:hypothetical protein